MERYISSDDLSKMTASEKKKMLDEGLIAVDGYGVYWVDEKDRPAPGDLDMDESKEEVKYSLSFTVLRGPMSVGTGRNQLTLEEAKKELDRRLKNIAADETVINFSMWAELP